MGGTIKLWLRTVILTGAAAVLVVIWITGLVVIGVISTVSILGLG